MNRSAHGEPRALLLVKWGGSLITDKRTPRTPRPEQISRLAGELAAGLPALRERDLALVLGHGSGSFGHVAASRHRLADGLPAEGVGPAQLAGIAETQAEAASLHRLVLEALADAGVAGFSIAPSSALVADEGVATTCFAEPVARALAAGLVPVVYGDVVTDRRRGVSIASTEQVFQALAAALPGHGWQATEALWLGDTNGVYGDAGEPIAELSPAEALRLRTGGAAGTDVTGGMAHRLEAAARLATAGVTSTIADGREAGLLHAYLAGGTAPGTRVASG